MGFGIGIVIGTGIFTLTRIEAKNHAGPGVVISFVIAGAVSLLARLLRRARLVGAHRGVGLYLRLRAIGKDARVNVGAMAVVALLGVVAVIGIRESARVTNLLVAVKVLICVFVIVLGAFFVTSANLTPFTRRAAGRRGHPGLKQPLSPALFGIEPTAFGVAGVLTAAASSSSPTPGSRPSRPRRGDQEAQPTAPGLHGTLGICTVLYVGVSLVITGMVPHTALDEGALIASAFDAVGRVGRPVSVAAVAGLTSVILVDLVAMGRIGFSRGRAASCRRPSRRCTHGGPAPPHHHRDRRARQVLAGFVRSGRWPTS